MNIQYNFPSVVEYVFAPPNRNRNPDPTLTLIVTERDPDYRQNLKVCSMVHVPPSQHTFWKLVE